MANALLTPSVITKEALAILHQKLNFVGNINTQYDDQYAKSGAKIGNDLKIRLPNEFTVRTGATLSSQDVDESSTTLTVDTQKGVDFTFSSEELTMHIDEFKDRYLEPAMSVLAANIESDALSMYKDVYNFYSGVGAANSFGNITQAQKLLTDSLAPYGDRSYLHNPQSVVDMLADTKGLFQDSSSISKQYKDGQLGKIAGFEHYENTLMPVHTTGTAAATTGYLVNGASQSGSSLTVDGGTTTFLKGDVVTIAGVNRVHPETKANTGVLQQFVVTADSGSSATTLAVSPAITATGGRQNVSAVPADNAAISKIGGGASADWQETLAFSKNAFAFATADLILPNGVDFAAREVSDGISMRIVRDYAISSDTMPCRIDVLYGYKAIRPQLAARVGIN
tara:strand:+ start:929 stop:2116 length:1188 start_codon:yes stop_codon:yes gene_type:complete